MLFDLYTNYNLVSGKQYKQKLRPQNSQKKGYMYCLIKMYELTGEIFSVSLLFVWLDNGEYLFAKEETFDEFLSLLYHEHTKRK